MFKCPAMAEVTNKTFKVLTSVDHQERKKYFVGNENTQVHSTGQSGKSKGIPSLGYHTINAQFKERERERERERVMQ